MGLLWCPSILVWYNSLCYSRVSFTGSMDSYTERYNSYHVDNCVEMSKKMDFTKQMTMLFIDTCTFKGYSLIPLAPDRSFHPFDQYLKLLSDMVTINGSREEVKKVFKDGWETVK